MIGEGANGAITRPDAPYMLRCPEEVAVWRSIVDALPADYFAPTTFPLLIQLCRHVVLADRVAQLIEAFCKRKKIDYPELAALGTMQSVESANIIKLSRQLRLSPQSIYRGKSAKVRPTVHSAALAPWHRGDPG